MFKIELNVLSRSARLVSRIMEKQDTGLFQDPFTRRFLNPNNNRADTYDTIIDIRI